jgi:hypothetical protein
MRALMGVCLSLTLVALSVEGQSKNSLIGRTFKNSDLGLTYSLPESLVPQPDIQLPRDSQGREEILLALWDETRQTPDPRITFLYDKKVAHMPPGQHALRYLHSAPAGPGYKLTEPRKVSMGGTTMWRMDYSRPDESGHSYSSAIVIPFSDGTLLFIQMNAPSQSQLDSLVGSLNTLRVDKR